MKPLTSRGSLPCWLYVISLLLAVLGGFSPQVARADNRWIVTQPAKLSILHPLDKTAPELTVEFCPGGSADNESVAVDWYRNGKYLTTLSATRVLVEDTVDIYERWDPLYLNPDGTYGKRFSAELLVITLINGVVQSNGAENARVIYTSTLEDSTPGIYHAEIREARPDKLITNVAQVVVMPSDPLEAFKVVRNPENRYKEAPSAGPNFTLWADMLSHVRGTMDTPSGICGDSRGFTYVADTLNHVIRRISPGGQMTTIAGMDGNSGGGDPYFQDVLTDAAGNDVFSANSAERAPSKGYRDGATVQSLARNSRGYRNAGRYDDISILSEPLFDTPTAIAISDISEYSENRVIYVSDTGNDTIRRIRTVGSTTTVSDLLPVGFFSSRPLNAPRGLVFSGSSIDPSNPPCLYVVDGSAYMIKKIYLNPDDGSLDTSKGDPHPDDATRKCGIENIAGRGVTPGWQMVPTGVGELELYKSRGLAVDTTTTPGSPIFYVADAVNHVILEIRKNAEGLWVAQVRVGFAGEKGHVNAVGTRARLYYPMGLALDEERHLLYFTEFGNHTVRRVNLPDNSRGATPWQVDAVAGRGVYGPRARGETGDGVGTEAQFFYPAGIFINKDYKDLTLDHVNNTYLHVADSNNHVIRRITIPMGTQPTGGTEGIGTSSAIAGMVGVSRNRDFAELREFEYAWKRDGQRLENSDTSVVQSVVSGADTDTLSVRSAQPDDAGVYGVEVQSTAGNEFVEAGPAFVYLSAEGKRPRFVDPGYKIEAMSTPGVALTSIKRDDDLVLTADIIPADQVTYQWQVAEDVPDLDGNYAWTDLIKGNGSNWRPDANIDSVANAQRTELTRLLGGSNQTVVEFTYLDGVPHKQMIIRKIQSSLSVGIPPRLRFRVKSLTRIDPTLQVSTPLEVDTDLLKVAAITSWSVSTTEQSFRVSSTDGFYIGMLLIGPGIAPNTTITEIKPDPLDPTYKLLVVDKFALEARNNTAIYGAVDLFNGVTLPTRFPVVFTNPVLSLQINGGTAQLMADSAVQPLAVGASVKLALAGGAGSAQGYPAPTYQWNKTDPLTRTKTPIAGATKTDYAISSIAVADRAYYSVTATNTEGVSVESNSVLLDVERPPNLTVLSMTLDGGSLAQDLTFPQVSPLERVVDKRLSPGITLRANVDASDLPDYTWKFRSNLTGVTTTIVPGLTSVLGTGVTVNGTITYGELSVSDFSEDGDGVVTVTVSVKSKNGLSVEPIECSWNISVKPPLTIQSMTALSGGTTQSVAIEQPITVDKLVSRSLLLRANVYAPNLPAYLPKYTWSFTPASGGAPVNIVSAATNMLGTGIATSGDFSYGQLSVSNFSEDAGGVLKLTVTVSKKNGQPWVTQNCSWRITVKPPNLTILSMTASDGGTTQSVEAVQDITVDKQVSPSLLLRANIDAPTSATYAPTYAWSFTSAYGGAPVNIVSAATSILGTGIVTRGDSTSSQVSVSNFSDDASGVLKLTVTVFKENRQPWVTQECSWRVIVRPPNIRVVSRTVGGDLARDGGLSLLDSAVTQEVVVDKTRAKVSSEALRLMANFEASALSTCSWTFKSDYTGLTTDLARVGTSVQLQQLNYAVLSFTELSDDADGVFTLTATVPARGRLPAATTSCSWHVSVKYLPKFVPGSKIFLLGGQPVGTSDIAQDVETVDLNQKNALVLGATFLTPRTLESLTYRWRRDRSILASKENLLALPLVSRKDIGEYTLEVSNGLGTVSFPAWKLVGTRAPSLAAQLSGKPLIVASSSFSAAQAGMVAAAPRPLAAQAPPTGSASQTLHVARGQRLALQVTVDADPPPTYQWYQGSYPNGIPVSGAVSAIYVLPPVTSPVGSVLTYYVTATNRLGQISSEPVDVRVDGFPVVTVEPEAFSSGQPVSMPYPSGSDVSLAASVTDADALYTYQWKFNGNAILGATKQNLVLSKIATGQAGSYSVVVTGVAGTTESAKLALTVEAVGLAPKYQVTFQEAETLKTKVVVPMLAETGVPAGTRVSLLGFAPYNQMLQSWDVSYQDQLSGETVSARLPARSAKFVMPAANVTVNPILSRSYAGNYTGLLSLEAPWNPADEWHFDPTLFDLTVPATAPFRSTGLMPDPGMVRGLFTCTVTTLGAVSGQIQLENKLYSFTTVLDSEMKGSFRIATILKGVPWTLKGELSFNSTEENRLQGYVDNVLHVVLSDVLLATPPLVQAGQTLYCSAAGVLGAAEALQLDVNDGLLANSLAAAAPAAAAASAASAGVDRFAAAGIPAYAIEGAAAAPSSPPKILQQPKDTIAALNGTVTFSVVVESPNNPYVYRWTAPDGRTFSGPSFQISNITQQDFGFYQVRIRNLSDPDQEQYYTVSRAARLIDRATLDTGGGGGSGNPATPPGPMVFTAAAYRQTDGETLPKTYGQGAVLSVQVRQPMGNAVVQGYLPNGTKVTFSTYLGRAYTTPQFDGPAGVDNQPTTAVAAPYFANSATFNGQAVDALSETLVRRTSSQTVSLWFRGDTSTEPLFGTMVFNGPNVYGALGALNLDNSSGLSVYTPNALAGYFFNPNEPHLASLPASQFAASQTVVALNTESYVNGLPVNWPGINSTPVPDTVLATVDRTTGLLIGGMLESTKDRYVQLTGTPYSPAWAEFKPLLACTAAGVIIQKPNIFPGFPAWSDNPLGGYVGFLYRGKSAPVERLKNVLGNGTPEAARLNNTVINRVEPFLINITEQY